MRPVYNGAKSGWNVMKNDELEVALSDLTSSFPFLIHTSYHLGIPDLDWKICYRDPLPTWVSRSHKIVLLGDSCHPHLPTSAQGASQATESAAVLAICLKLAGKDNVPLAVSIRPHPCLFVRPS